MHPLKSFEEYYTFVPDNNPEADNIDAIKKMLEDQRQAILELQQKVEELEKNKPSRVRS